MRIRAATTGDSASIAAFWNPMIRDTAVTFNSIEKSREDVAEMIEEKARGGYAFLVAELEGRVVAFATYGQFRAGLGYAHTMEHTIILGSEARGKGIGRALMAAIEDHARAAGAHSIFAGVSGENHDGIAFHEAIGYRTAVVLPEVGRKFGRWMDLHLMQKFL